MDERGLSVFDALRFRLRDHAAVLCAFDLIELDGEDLRGRPLEHRKGTLADLLRGVRDGIAFNRHYEGMARLSLSTPVRSVARVSYPSGLDHPIARGARHIG